MFSMKQTGMVPVQMPRARNKRRSFGVQAGGGKCLGPKRFGRYPRLKDVWKTRKKPKKIFSVIRARERSTALGPRGK
jgi:hypothetical protein